MGCERSLAARALRTAVPTLLACAAFSPCVAQAQPLGAIAGTMFLAGSDAPISGGQVCLEGLTACALTDAQGEYVIAGVPTVKDKVAFTYRGNRCDKGIRRP